MRAPETILMAIIVGGVGCASGRGQTRTEEKPEPVVATAAAPETKPAAQQAKPAASRPVLPVKRVAPAKKGKVQQLPLTVSLKRFTAVRGTQHKRKAAQMPDDVERQWRVIFAALEESAIEEMEPGREGEMLSTLMRTRMTLETEFQLDKRRYKEVPTELQSLLTETLAALDEQVVMLRAASDGFALGEDFGEDAVVTLRNPVQLVNITSYFGRRRDPILRKQTRMHAGVDFGGATGTLVTAAGPGVVAHADWQGGGGNHIIIVHANGLRTHYSHLSRILVKQGMMVEGGQPLGLMGETGRATGPHLHFAVSRHGSFMDPLDVLDVPIDRDGPVEPDS